MHWRLSAFLLILLCLWGGSVQAETSVPVEIATDTVRINEAHIDSLLNQYPLLVYRDVTYMPLTYDFCRFVGLSSVWSAEHGLQLHRLNVSSPYRATHDRLNQPHFIYYAERVAFNISFGGRPISLDDKYPWLLFRDITYMPLTWTNVVELMGWQLDWDATTGLSITQRQAADSEYSLLALLSARLLNEYRFYADYQDQVDHLWLQGEHSPIYQAAADDEASALTMQISSDSCFWYQGLELFSRFGWSLPLDLAQPPVYTQSGGALPSYAANSSFAEHPLARFPLLLFDEILPHQTARWQVLAPGSSYRLNLGPSSEDDLNFIELQLSENGDAISTLLWSGVWIQADGSSRTFQLAITFEAIPATRHFSLYAETSAQFLQPLSLNDGGMVLLTHDGQVVRLNRQGEMVWQFTAAPQLYGRALDEQGNLYVWSYQNLWCLNRYGQLLWQRALGLQSLSVQNRWLLISQRLGEHMQWEILNTANGTRTFLLPEDCKQATWVSNAVLALSDERLLNFAPDGRLLWERKLPTASRDSREEFFFDLQYSLLVAARNWIVLHQQSPQEGKILCFDGDGNPRGEIAGLTASCQVEPYPSGIYLINAGTLFWWSPDGGLQRLQSNVSGVPAYLADGGYAFLSAQYPPYTFVRLVNEANQSMWQHQLAWASNYGGPLLFADDYLVTLAIRALTAYDVTGLVLWQTLLLDFGQTPQQLLTTTQDQIVVWNGREIDVVDAQGRIRYTYRLVGS